VGGHGYYAAYTTEIIATRRLQQNFEILPQGIVVFANLITMPFEVGTERFITRTVIYRQPVKSMLLILNFDDVWKKDG